jgi:hypothetical protein
MSHMTHESYLENQRIFKTWGLSQLLGIWIPEEAGWTQSHNLV